MEKKENSTWINGIDVLEEWQLSSAFPTIVLISLGWALGVSFFCLAIFNSKAIQFF